MEMISRVVYQLGLRKQITNKAEFVPEFQRYMGGCQAGSVVVFDNLDATVKAPSTVSTLDIFQSVFLMPQNPLQNFPVCLVVVATLPKGAPVAAPVTEEQANSPDYVPQVIITLP